jgi:hypothetical protein
MIILGGLILIGLREWENPHKTSDLITVYSSYEIEKLKTITSINLSMFPLEDINGIASSISDSNLIFTNNTTYSESSDNLPKLLQKIHQPIEDCNEDFDIDDI